MLCESRVINQNPKYRIIKYNNEYFMVDLVSTWIAYFLPMINWFIPKKYAKISREEFESLNIVKPAKNNTFWPVAGFAVLLTTLTRKYIYLLNIHLEKRNSYINMLYDTSRCFRIVYIYKYKIEVTYF
ncbi:membrane spanning protein [Staphylococcus aureus]|nr:membrane spanning protein [Staphylococcus aureus]